MKKITLGKTGIEVSELCFGALPIGPLQKNVDEDEAAAVMAQAFSQGVTFVDTAQMYRTYGALRKAMAITGERPVISTKSAAETYADMDAAVRQALEELDADYLDIFLLHAARVGPNVFDERAGALRCLLDWREKGVIQAVGISCHAVDVASKAAADPRIDVVFPIVNRQGLGIMRGTLAQMEDAVMRCFEAEKGVYLMKVLGGGTFIGDYKNSIEYARDFAAGRAAIVLGMVERGEAVMNCKYFNGEDISEELSALKSPNKRFAVFGAVCKDCGRCLEACAAQAIASVDGKAAIDDGKCLKCGYCVPICPEFAIRMI